MNPLQITSPWTVFYIALLPLMTLIASFLFTLFFLYPLSSIVPDFSLAILFYWAIYRPTSLPLSIIFFVGLFMDALSGCFLGLHAFVYILIWVLLIYQRRYLFNKTFLLNWSVFGCVALIASIVEATAASIAPYESFDGLHFFVELFATIVSGPLIFKLCATLNKKLG